ncbi:hypothetical protein [Sporosarcina sp. HYO08]|uniref:hypothetical protein n=1 Tax=Sporosarcina sp. HYO08 TaxID=1759557 RepID=UPI00079B7583|nr:hypothetical protein [Sporosarcina sp. HYO08]KXH87372.1 hypothetical protein AU377_02020 [Sporosarcina sp. HYO08]
MKKIQYDNLNYTPPKRSAIDEFAQWYEENGTSKPNDTPSSDSVESLRKAYEQDPSSLNGLQLMSLGFADLNAEQEMNSKAHRKAANDYHHKDGDE